MAGRKRLSRRSTTPVVGKEDIFKYLQQSEYRTANLRQILEDFEATPEVRRQIKDILNQLVKEGKVAHHKGNRYEAPAQEWIDGTIILHRDSYGFVVPKQKIE